MAISACREEHGDRIQNRAQMMTVKETLNDGYCDVTGGGDITNVGMLILSALGLFRSLNQFVTGSVAGYKVFFATGEHRSCSSNAWASARNSFS